MKNGWEIIPMGQLCSIKSGKSDTKDAVENGPYAFFDRSRTIKKSSRFLYDCEALIIPGEGTEFLPKHFIGKFDLHQRAYALFGFSTRINIKFLYYYLHHLCDYFPRVAVGATVKSLRMRHFEQLPVSVTNLPEQQQIVGILDKAFEGIATAKANAEKNLQNARALFQSHLQSVFTQRGEGWVEKRLGHVCEFRRGLTYSKDDEVDLSDNVVLRAMNIDLASHLLDFTELKYISDEVIVPEGKKVKQGSLMICTASGSKSHLGKIAFIDDDYGYAFGGFMGMLTPNSDLVPKYLFYLMTSSAYEDFIGALADGMNINNLKFDELKQFQVAYPLLPEQQRIVGIFDALSAKTQHLASLYERKLAALEALKKSLLHQAFTGQLTKVAA